MTTNFRVDGAMDDVRLGAGWAPLNWLRVGFGAPRDHRAQSDQHLTQSFADSAQFSAFRQRAPRIQRRAPCPPACSSFSKFVTAGVSGRRGGNLNMRAEDTLLTSAKYRIGLAHRSRITGIANSSISVRTSRDSWSSLGGLGTPGMTAVDAWDTSVGADLAGPQIGQRILFLRGGYRTRTFHSRPTPYGNGTASPAGSDTAFAAEHVLGDLAIDPRQSGPPNLSATENAWTISIGISVRP